MTPAWSVVGYALLSFLLFIHTTSATPLLLHDVEDLASPGQHLRGISRQNSSDYAAVTGIVGHGVRPRLEIRELEKNADQMNIYLLGLRRSQQTDQDDTLSYFQLSGIHGRPYAPWDNVQPSDPSTTESGYCLHNSNLFLTWHRPYVALWEQVLYQHIRDAANEFPAGAVRDRYASAALGWRQPFWDWALPPTNGQSALPSSLSSPIVTVMTPNGTETIPNPLYSYHFHPPGGEAFAYDIWKDWTHTLRHGTNNTLQAVSQDDVTDQMFAQARPQWTNTLYNLFVNYNNFSEFGNQVWKDETNSTTYNSIESIHDEVHFRIGGPNGHMNFFEFAGFDPIFMLHHTTIDRSFALWQVLYPDSFVEPLNAPNASYTVEQGQLLDVDSGLKPFRNKNGSFWTSAEVRSTEVFGYLYPETAGNASASSVTAAINKLYGTKSRRADALAALSRKFNAREANPALAKDAPPRHVLHGLDREYIANIISPKGAEYGSYSIYIFVGEAGDDANAWPYSENLAGTRSIFSMMGSASMGAGTLVTGTVPLTDILLAKAATGELCSLDPQDVEEFLGANLRLRIAMSDGTQMSPEGLAGLKISIMTADVQPSLAADKFPVWSNFSELPGIGLHRLTESRIA